MKLSTLITVQLAGLQLTHAMLNDNQPFDNPALMGRRPTSLRRMSSLFGAVWEPTALKAGSINCFIDGVDVGFHCLMEAAAGEEGANIRANVNARTCDPGEASTALIDWRKARNALIDGQITGYIPNADGSESKGELLVSDEQLETMIADNRLNDFADGLPDGQLYQQFLDVGIRRLRAHRNNNPVRAEKQYYNTWLRALRVLLTDHDLTKPSDDIAKNNVHCHGSDQSHQYQHVVSDHLGRGYAGVLSCACGYKSLKEYILPGTEGTTNTPWQSIENDPAFANTYQLELWNRIKMHTLDGVASDCDITTSTRGQRRYDFNRNYGVQQIEGIPQRMVKIGNRRVCGRYGSLIAPTGNATIPLALTTQYPKNSSVYVPGSPEYDANHEYDPASPLEPNTFRWIDEEWGLEYLEPDEQIMYDHFSRGVNARCRSNPAVRSREKECFLMIETTCVTNNDGVREKTTTQMNVPDYTGDCAGYPHA